MYCAGKMESLWSQQEITWSFLHTVLPTTLYDLKGEDFPWYTFSILYNPQLFMIWKEKISLDILSPYCTTHNSLWFERRRFPLIHFLHTVQPTTLYDLKGEDFPWYTFSILYNPQLFMIWKEKISLDTLSPYCTTHNSLWFGRRRFPLITVGTLRINVKGVWEGVMLSVFGGGGWVTLSNLFMRDGMLE